MRLRLVREPFDHPDYIFELKHDGFRAVVYIQNGECKILSRNSNQLRFKSLRENLARLQVQDAIIDGEIICIDRDGVSRFNHLLDRKHESVLYAFDLLWINGVDLRRRPLLERKKQLERLVRTSGLRLMYAQHVEKDGKDLFKEICARDLEGVVAKRKLSVHKDDGTGWLKIKNRAYSQAEGRHELLTRKSASTGPKDSK
jgi:bifunctional non-homologous end joining protein LigD